MADALKLFAKPARGKFFYRFYRILFLPLYRGKFHAVNR